MNLSAYIQIEDLEEVAKANGIEVPRLRGYSLMKDEESVCIEDMFKNIHLDGECARNLCQAQPFWNPNAISFELSSETDFYVKYFCKELPHWKYEPRWDRIHGRMRKTLKTYIHNRKQKIKKQYETWNKYVGREDILYIHSRIGGGNWFYYHSYVDTQPWFIEKVDDSFDSTYCDIYAKINPNTIYKKCK